MPSSTLIVLTTASFAVKPVISAVETLQSSNPSGPKITATHRPIIASRLSALSVTIGGTYEGLGKGLPSLVISVIRYIVIIPVAALLSLPLQAAGVWHAFWVTELVAAVVSALMFRRYMRGILPPEKRSSARRAAE